MQWLNFIVHCKVLFNNHKIFQICYGDFINNIERPSILWQKYCFPTFERNKDDIASPSSTGIHYRFYRPGTLWINLPELYASLQWVEHICFI
jgi:hypothetical protein